MQFDTRATAVIPAYNEAARVERVLAAVAGAAWVDEVIVVDDGSVDGTAAVVAGNGALLVRLGTNRGKAAALREGVTRARNSVVVFLDADLVGVTPEHVDSLVGPVLAGEADMTVGQFRGGNAWLSLWQRLVPSISGQRALLAQDFLSLTHTDTMGFAVEAALTRYAAREKLRTRLVGLPNMSHVIKERKRGALRGLRARLAMYAEILRWTYLNGHGGRRGADRGERA